MQQAFYFPEFNTVKNAPLYEIPYIYDKHIREMVHIAETEDPLRLALYMRSNRFDVNQHIDKQLMKDNPLIVEAAKRNHSKLVKLLVELGAHIDKRGTSTYKTAFLCAVENNNASLVHFLLEKGANPRIADIDENTSYMIAKTKKYTKIHKMLDDWLDIHQRS